MKTEPLIERFQRRLSEEIGALRVDMAKEFAAVRVDMAKEFGAVRVDMATLAASMHSDTLETRAEMATLTGATRADILKWSFLFWLGQVAALAGIMAFLLRTIGTR